MFGGWVGGGGRQCLVGWGVLHPVAGAMHVAPAASTCAVLLWAPSMQHPSMLLLTPAHAGGPLSTISGMAAWKAFRSCLKRRGMTWAEPAWMRWWCGLCGTGCCQVGQAGGPGQAAAAAGGQVGWADGLPSQGHRGWCRPACKPGCGRVPANPCTPAQLAQARAASTAVTGLHPFPNPPLARPAGQLRRTRFAAAHRPPAAAGDQRRGRPQVPHRGASSRNFKWILPISCARPALARPLGV